MRSDALAKRVAKFVEDPNADDFGALALALFSEVYADDESYRAACDRQGASPGRVNSWREIPASPAAPLGPGTELQESAARRVLAGAMIGDLTRPPVLLTVPEGADGDLREPCASISADVSGEGSADCAPDGRVDVGAARSWLAARQRDGRPAVLVATAAAADRILSTLERQDLLFQLAYGSRAIVTTAAPDDPSEAELAKRFAARLSLAPDRVLLRQGWPGVPTPVFPPAAGASDTSPAWLRTVDLEGAQTVFDLTILDRPFRITAS